MAQKAHARKYKYSATWTAVIYNPGQKTSGHVSKFWAKSREFTVHASIVI